MDTAYRFYTGAQRFTRRSNIRARNACRLTETTGIPELSQHLYIIHHILTLMRCCGGKWR